MREESLNFFGLRKNPLVLSLSKDACTDFYLGERMRKLFIALVSVFFNYNISAEDPKEWTVMIYMGARNKLVEQADRNLSQASKVGSNERLNVVAQIDQRGNDKVRRISVERNKICEIESLEANDETVSGGKNSLRGFCEWAIKNYPAKHYAIILWGCGHGVKDGFGNGERLEDEDLTRGVCFNEDHRLVVSTKMLGDDLAYVSSEFIGGKKIDVVGFDACMMSMVEIASEISESSDFMVASSSIMAEEGWNYEKVLEPVAKEKVDPGAFASHIVDAYAKEYENTENGNYTIAAIDLGKVHIMEENLSEISKNLIDLFLKNPDPDFMESLLAIKREGAFVIAPNCYDRDFRDILSLYVSITQALMDNFLKITSSSTASILMRLMKALGNGPKILDQVVAHKAYDGVPGEPACFTVYFPAEGIYDGYSETIFNKRTGWVRFLNLLGE